MKLVGHENFKRVNPFSDRFLVQRFHHLEYWCQDASNTYRRFAHGLGMGLVGKSDQSTGNSTFASYVVRSNDVMFAFTAPYSDKIDGANTGSAMPWYDQGTARQFVCSHGLAVRAVGLLVDDAAAAYVACTAAGGQGITPPHTLTSSGDNTKRSVVSEVRLYGDVVLRFVSNHGFEGEFLPSYQPTSSSNELFGLQRIDHVVGNVPKLLETCEYIVNMTGFHEFAEFVAEDVGTLDSGLNSMVLACNSESVLLPINEPTFGTRRKSQIQTYLEHNEGPGVQHIALKTDDIFHTLRRMRSRTESGGFDFMPSPSKDYYLRTPARVGENVLTEAQWAECEELGILVDKDDQGVLLQIFTKPLGDRPTVFVEVIQRVGCMASSPVEPAVYQQTPGCGGFGKGNFSELFKSIEDYERTLDAVDA